MKYVLKRMLNCLYVFIFIGAISCQSRPGFVIEGSIDFPRNGNILVITPNASDTFAKAPIIDGKFKITGSVDSITEAALIYEGAKMGSFPFFLENSENTFYAKLYTKDSIHENQVIGGGVQNIAALFRKKSVEYNRYQLDPVIAAISRANQYADYQAMDTLREKYYKIIKLADDCEDSLLHVYNDTYVAAYLINLKFKGEPQLLRQKSEILGPNAWNTTYGRAIKKTLEQYKGLDRGQQIPDFTVVSAEGDSISLRRIPGKIKLINFWASWSRASAQENLVLSELYEKYHSKGLVIIGITTDVSKERWLNALQYQNLPWLQFANFANVDSILNTFVIASLPTNYLLDSENRIIGRNIKGEMLQKELHARLK